MVEREREREKVESERERKQREKDCTKIKCKLSKANKVIQFKRAQIKSKNSSSRMTQRLEKVKGKHFL